MCLCWQPLLRCSRGLIRERWRGYGLRVTEKACPLLVPLVEEGWLDTGEMTGAVTAEVLRIYLEEARRGGSGGSDVASGVYALSAAEGVD